MIMIGVLGFLGGGGYAFAETGPESAVLDSLAEYYAPVQFNHSMHVDLAEGKCAKCHHHTTGAVPLEPRCLQCHKGGSDSGVYACKDCHPLKRFEADYLAALDGDRQRYHLDKPGLKGAYHRNCLACHTENGGPTGCQECHLRNAKGDALFRADIVAPATGRKSGGH
jgi:hypothetical protein